MTTPHPFDLAVRLTAAGEGAYTGRTHPAYANQVGPFGGVIAATLLDLPLGNGAQREFTVAIDTGSYGKIEFEIHKASSGDDSAFVALHPEFADASIRVTGTYNGVAFTYVSDLDVEQEYDFVPPLTVTESTGANVTLFVDLNAWFLNQNADGLIDPATANKGGQLEGEVKSNIEASLNAFEDDDRDGEDDNS